MLDRVRSMDPRQVDIAFAVSALVALELWCGLSGGMSGHERLVSATAAVFLVAPLAIRRAYPGPALVASALVIAVQTLAGGQLLSGPVPSNTVPVLVLLALGYGAGAWLEAGPSTLGLFVALGLVAGAAFVPGFGALPHGAAIASSVFYSSLTVAPGWFVGRLARGWSRRSAAFHELAEETAAEQAVRQSSAVAAERARIGAELQDIIAHSVSVMVIHAGGARMQLRNDPERARQSLLNVEHTGREALAELRRLLGMLRKDDDPRALNPQPGLDQLGSLLDSYRSSGLSCDLTTLGDLVDLTPGVNLVAYRALEAALAAAARRGVDQVAVAVRYTPRQLELEVRVDQPIDDLDDGIDGIAQRVALYDGRLRVKVVDGCSSVLVQLPLRATLPV